MELKVLLVDDEKDILDIYEGMLQGYCTKIIRAKNGVEAVNLLDRERDFNVAIIDLEMPSMDGFELISEIKAKHPEVLMTVSTATSLTEETIEELLSKGVLGFLFKPTTRDELLSHIEGVVALYSKHAA